VLSFLMDPPSVELLSSFCTESAAMAAFCQESVQRSLIACTVRV
jgi:hypothetical protein